MVVKLVWIHSWVTVAISICTLIAVILFVGLCLCWQRRDPQPVNHQFYILDDDNGMRNTTSEGFLRKFSNAGLLRNNLRFSTRKLEPKHPTGEKSNLIGNESDLMDSLDVDKQFNDVVLKIDQDCRLKVARDDDDNYSCVSNDSRHTFYSIYPITRANSMAETMRSASSQPEALDKY